MALWDKEARLSMKELQALAVVIMKAYSEEKEQPLAQINPTPVVNSQSDISIRQGKTEIIIRQHE